MNINNRFPRFVKFFFLFPATFVVLALLSTSAVLGQKEISDSLLILLKTDNKQDTTRVNRLNLLAIAYKNLKPDSAQTLINESLELSTHLSYKAGEAKAWNAQGNLLINKRDFDGAISAYQKAIQIRQEMGDELGEAQYRKNLGSAYLIMGLNLEALAELEKVKIIYLRIGNRSDLISALSDLGRTYSALDRFDEAFLNLKQALLLSRGYDSKLEGAALINLASLFVQAERYSYALSTAKQALIIFEEDNFTVGKGVAEGIIANAYVRMEKFDDAIVHYEKAMQCAIETGDKVGLVKRLNNLSAVYFGIKNYPKTKEFLIKAIAITKNEQVSIDNAIGLGNLSMIFLEMGETDSAIFFGEKSFEMYTALNDSLGNPILNRTLARAYASEGNYSKAYTFEKKLNEVTWLHDSLRKMEMMQELETKYETERKAKEIEKLLIVNELKESEIRKFQIILITAISIFLLAVLVIVFYVRSRKIKAEKKSLELEQMALSAQMNPHFIFNSLNSIQQLYIQQDFDKASDYMADFSRLLRTILENSSKSSIRLSEEIKYLDLYCRIEQMRTDESFEYTIIASSDILSKDIRIQPMVIQPLVENAIWHGILPKKEKGHVTVQINDYTEKELEIVVEDNGVGWRVKKEGDTHNSKGIELIEKRIGRKVQITHLEPGTRISFKIKKL